MTLRAKAGFVVILFSLCFGATAAAQLTHPPLNAPFSLQSLETGATREDATDTVRLREGRQFKSKYEYPVRFHKAGFIILSAGVYAASLADIHQTLEIRKQPWWYETDPLARPFVHLPAPAYYATGLAMATGVNWLSWKMGHTQRWRKLSFIPQLLTIGGNVYGFRSNRH